MQNSYMSVGRIRPKTTFTVQEIIIYFISLFERTKSELVGVRLDLQLFSFLSNKNSRSALIIFRMLFEWIQFSSRT